MGIPRSDLPDWVCLVRYESNFKTTATNTNKNKTKDWGIFQINDRWWCKPDDGRQSHNGCNINCSSLLKDDITAAVNCAKRVKKEQGFKAWYGWKSHCQTTKISVNECF
ncbi:lysozyme c-1-like [Eupeodes corollae]|uniref:lysozyme c-1-like n=1 Tax=Eupeodes corollae TaxID=290404 RepID=UPI00249385DD|nr:lysozyme c-1-like [Eupeodes corollae]